MYEQQQQQQDIWWQQWNSWSYGRNERMVVKRMALHSFWWFSVVIGDNDICMQYVGLRCAANFNYTSKFSGAPQLMMRLHLEFWTIVCAGRSIRWNWSTKNVHSLLISFWFYLLCFIFSQYVAEFRMLAQIELAIFICLIFHQYTR